MGQTCGIPGDPEREKRALKGFSRASETQTHRLAMTTLRVTLFWGACTASCGGYVMIRVQGKVLKPSFRGVREEEEKIQSHTQKNSPWSLHVAGSKALSELWLEGREGVGSREQLKQAGTEQQRSFWAVLRMLAFTLEAVESLVF